MLTGKFIFLKKFRPTEKALLALTTVRIRACFHGLDSPCHGTVVGCLHWVEGGAVLVPQLLRVQARRSKLSGNVATSRVTGLAQHPC